MRLRTIFNCYAIAWLQVGVGLQVDEMLTGRKTLFENFVFGAQVSAIDCPPTF